MPETIQKVKMPDGSAVMRVWDEIDEIASKTGNAIKKINHLIGRSNKALKKPALTTVVTGSTLNRKREEKLGY